MSTDFAEICKTIKEYDNFLIVSHEMPDGDAIASQLGIAHILKDQNKKFRLYNVSGFPSRLDWINTGFTFIDNLAELGNFKPEVCIFLDCGDDFRAGLEIHEFLESKRFPITISIDHHRDNPNFATLNWVEPTISSTAYMVAQIAKELGLGMAGNLGKVLYLGLVEDTGSFSYSNTDARTLLLAAEIVEQGLNVGTFSACLDNIWSMERIRFWGKLSNDIELDHNNTIAYVCVTEQMLDQAGVTSEELSDFASYMRRIKETKACALIRESEPGVVKVSMRSVFNVNVQKVAAHLGGGGHMNAAAFKFRGTIENLVKVLLPILAKEIDNAEDISCN